jgi:hypothetical protein
MIEAALQPRILETKDWATITFVIILCLLVVAKSSFENRFSDYIRLLVSDKYSKVYKDGSQLQSGFSVLLFFISVFSASFFILLLTNYYNIGHTTDGVLFIRITTLVFVFVLAKYLIEKIIATSFGIEEIVETFNLKKLTYRSYVFLITLPIVFVLYFTNYVTNNFIFYLFIALFAINMLTYLFSLRIYQNLIIKNLFYFILYLCAFEIAPYYFLYYLILKY